MKVSVSANQGTYVSTGYEKSQSREYWLLIFGYHWKLKFLKVKNSLKLERNCMILVIEEMRWKYFWGKKKKVSSKDVYFWMDKKVCENMKVVKVL